MIVQIPGREQHEGWDLAVYEISDNCPKCGGPRGEKFKGFSFDGSRRLVVDCWTNPCGHVDYYKEVRKEGQRVQLRFESPIESK